MTMTLREEALKLHMDNNGKIAVVSKVPIATRHDLAIAYTPGVAEPCKDIKEDKNLSFEYTCRGNMVAIITDGTRVLGLGDIGPEAYYRFSTVPVAMSCTSTYCQRPRFFSASAAS
jgi:malate dehydrogenase (oxaloacetate-decarboxylating)